MQVKALMDLLGMKVKHEDVEQMIDEIDADGSGQIDFEEFLEVGQDINMGHVQPDWQAVSRSGFEHGRTPWLAPVWGSGSAAQSVPRPGWWACHIYKDNWQRDMSDHAAMSIQLSLATITLGQVSSRGSAWQGVCTCRPQAQQLYRRHEVAIDCTCGRSKAGNNSCCTPHDLPSVCCWYAGI